MLGIYLGKRRSWQVWKSDDVWDLVTYIAFGAILGGRLGYILFYKFSYYISKPWEIFYVWEGGMSFHGGLLGVIFAIYLYAKAKNRTFYQVADFIAPLVPICIFTVRIANFINQELWGKPTTVAWGVVFPIIDNQPRHPSQLYEAFLEGLVLFIVLAIYSRVPRKPGAVAGLFLVGYGISRMFVEFFRLPDQHIGYLAFGWLTQGQLLSLPMVLFGLYLIWIRQAKPYSVK